jgi:peptide/nickel transport system ATP-binding protein
MTIQKNPRALLEVQGLKTYYLTLRGKVKAVDGVSFHIEKGEAIGLAGESGCGKSTIALSILRILPTAGRILGGKILFTGINLVELPEEYIREKIRWKGISVVFQGAMNALNPVYKIGDQIVEAIITHEPEISREDALDRTKKLLELVGINPLRADNYPHEYSGGMRQRALIAMSLACHPQLLIADEPGTALDVIVQAQILKLLRDLKEKLGLTMIVITHDLSIISEVCDKCAIMYAGRIVEYGDIEAIFKKPLHPYTKGLIEAFPQITGPKVRMTSIPGSPPDLLNPPPGCRFHPRCRYAMDICRKVEPASEKIEKDHFVECHLFTKPK